MKIFYLIIVAIVLASCVDLHVNKDVEVVPAVEQIEMEDGYFEFLSDVNIHYEDEALLPVARLLDSGLDQTTNVKPGDPESQNNVVRLLLDRSIEGLGEEGYILTVTEKQIQIAAPTQAGVFYGIQTLIQLYGTDKKEERRIPCMTIKDWPRFKWRGMHLDESRHFHGKEFVKKFIDILAMHKLNVFHWHLTDDQGWRIEIEQYPRLTSVGAWREDRRGEPWNIDDEQRQPYPDGKPYYGGFYTKEDIREIVDYAEKRFVTIVPEIEMPGHSRAALVAYPEYSCFGLETEVPPGGYVGEDWDFSDPYCAGKEGTFEFLENILDEVIELFPSQYIHIGGDECSKRRWSECPLCQKRIQEENLKDEFELQSYFIKRIEEYVSSKGRRIIGWQEILEGGMNPSAAIMPWRGASALEVALEAAQGGHQVVMAPSNYLYFNQSWPGDGSNKGGLSIEDVYEYEPIPSGLEEQYHSAIIGLQACIWGEHTPSYRDVEYQVVPRLAALAETAWTSKERKNKMDFFGRLEHLKAFYREMDINYYVPKPEGLSPKTVFTDSTQVALKVPSENHEVFYTKDGRIPHDGSHKYSNPFTVSESVKIRAVSVDAYGHTSKVVTGRFDKQDFLLPGGKAVKELKQGLQYRFFPARFRSAFELSEAEGGKKGVIEDFKVVHKNGEDDSGTIFEGYVEVPEKGIYTFYLASDDGSVLWVGDRQVVDNDGFKSARDRNTGEYVFKEGDVALDAGLHPIRLNYFDWGGGEEIKLKFSTENLEPQDVEGRLFH